MHENSTKKKKQMHENVLEGWEKNTEFSNTCIQSSLLLEI